MYAISLSSRFASMAVILQTVFVTDHGLDQHRYRHLRRIAKKQWQSGQPVKGEHSNRQLWRHIDHLNEDAAHQVARSIANVCARYPGCVLLFERLRKIGPKGGSKSRRMNRKRANQLRGKINQTRTRKPSCKVLSPSKSTRMGPVSIALAVATWGRGSPSNTASASE